MGREDEGVEGGNRAHKGLAAFTWIAGVSIGGVLIGLAVRFASDLLVSHVTGLPFVFN